MKNKLKNRKIIFLIFIITLFFTLFSIFLSIFNNNNNNNNNNDNDLIFKLESFCKFQFNSCILIKNQTYYACWDDCWAQANYVENDNFTLCGNGCYTQAEFNFNLCYKNYLNCIS